jgi:hypothetical protein
MIIAGNVKVSGSVRTIVAIYIATNAANIILPGQVKDFHARARKGAEDDEATVDAIRCNKFFYTHTQRTESPS